MAEIHKEFGKVMNQFNSGIKQKFNKERKSVLNEVKSSGINQIKKLEDSLDEQHEDFLHLKDNTEQQFDEVIDDLNEVKEKSRNNIREMKIMLLGTYGIEFKRLNDSDASHSEFLQTLIRRKVGQVILSSFLSLMRPGAMTWKNPREVGRIRFYFLKKSKHCNWFHAENVEI
eukprot:TRINITY_DN3025_c1_g1_i2.p1 TRINITY_DN3025_c1_g1~~TRINITY_DN3025_c1_g1_i2.p1  ORF type:complete len:172 (-),score=39.19 TRINITY_DN3025_c1_g1_i2:149-664(-)